jgi:hypothetical protein
MRMPFKASSRLAAPLIFATASLSLLALHCSSDPGAPSSSSAGTPSSGAGGTAAQAGSPPSGGMTTGGVMSAGTNSGGTPTGGTPTGGTPTGGTPTGGFTSGGSAGKAGASGAGGTTGGGGGGGGGVAGSSGSGGGGGGTAATFAQVKDLLMKTCAGAKCHDAASDQMDWTTSDGLYMRLTTAIPQGTPHCAGKVPVVANMPDQSLLLQAVKGSMPMCDSKALGRMPDNCSTSSATPRACLTDAQIKTISDWISAGAPQ